MKKNVNCTFSRTALSYDAWTQRPYSTTAAHTQASWALGRSLPPLGKPSKLSLKAGTCGPHEAINRYTLCISVYIYIMCLHKQIHTTVHTGTTHICMNISTLKTCRWMFALVGSHFLVACVVKEFHCIWGLDSDYGTLLPAPYLCLYGVYRHAYTYIICVYALYLYIITTHIYIYIHNRCIHNIQ